MVLKSKGGVITRDDSSRVYYTVGALVLSTRLKHVS